MAVRVGILALALQHGLACSAYAADVEVLALFGERAMLRIDGEEHLLQKGQSTPGGVRLLDVSMQGARLEIDGNNRFYPLGGRVRARYRAPDTEEVRIWRDPYPACFGRWVASTDCRSNFWSTRARVRSQ